MMTYSFLHNVRDFTRIVKRTTVAINPKSSHTFLNYIKTNEYKIIQNLYNKPLIACYFHIWNWIYEQGDDVKL